MADSRRFKEDIIINMTSLTMSKVVRSDAGEYTVTLKNEFGSCTWSIKLIVMGMLLVLYYFIFLSQVLVKKGRSLLKPDFCYSKKLYNPI